LAGDSAPAVSSGSRAPLPTTAQMDDRPEKKTAAVRDPVQVRTWTDVSGRTIEAKFLELNDDTVTLERQSDGQRFDLPLSRLALKDAATVRIEASAKWEAEYSTPPATTAAFGTLYSTTKDEPFSNTLGLKFVPSGTEGVLICVWPTRVRDFAAFVAATRHNAMSDVFSMRKGAWAQHGDSWKSPGFKQTPDHPVCGINWYDANAFCLWLTAYEHGCGLPMNAVYRLPSEAEWLTAAGTAEFPWGDLWPPPADKANVAGSESRDADTGSGWTVLEAHRDDYPRTSPVGTFAPNARGIYDLGGNVWQWCSDTFPGNKESRILHGGSWFSYEKEYLSTKHRGDGEADSRGVVRGFRVVLSLKS
jgi:hypothetical protein